MSVAALLSPTRPFLPRSNGDKALVSRAEVQAMLDAMRTEMETRQVRTRASTRHLLRQ